MEQRDQTNVQPRTFRIVLRGRLSERFASAFDGVRLEPLAGNSTLVGSLDQAQLDSVLERVSDFGLELLRVEELSE